MRWENPPFPRGATFFGGDTTQIETTFASALSLEGTEWEFEDLHYENTIGAPPPRSNRMVRCRVVRNTSGGALLPKQLVKLDATGVGAYLASADPECFGGRVSALTTTQADIAYPVDEYLPAAGVAANDLFYVVVSGPAKVVLDNTATPGITVGMAINPSAVGGGQAGTAAAQATSVASGAANAGPLQGMLGFALQANNVASTDLVISVRLHD